MKLLYKPDWDKVKERYRAWWQNEIIDRCMISVKARKDNVNAGPPNFPEKVEDRWLDFEYLHDMNEYTMKSTFYGGEALPIWCPGYPGWDYIPCYMGADVKLEEDTGWVFPMIEEGELTDCDYRKFIIDPENRWWIFSEKMHKYAVEEAKDKSLPGIQAIGGCGDILAALRGTYKLLFDLSECPEYVKEFEFHLLEQWKIVFNKFYNITGNGAEGSVYFFHIWAPGKSYALSNDFSYNISPKMFEDIYLPIIKLQTEFLDQSIYHVDGVNAFVHTDALLTLPKLQTIQILPGAGKPSPLYFMDTLKKVQAAKKNLHITIPADEVRHAMENLSLKGLFIQTECDTETEAKELIKLAGKIPRKIF